MKLQPMADVVVLAGIYNKPAAHCSIFAGITITNIRASRSKYLLCTMLYSPMRYSSGACRFLPFPTKTARHLQNSFIYRSSASRLVESTYSEFSVLISING